MENLKKITKEEMNELPYIIACDFDGTLVRDRYPDIGETNSWVVEALREAKQEGFKIVLWTCRDGKYLEDAVKHCENKFKLKFDAINENIPEVKSLFNNDTRKVYANEYWDDKSNHRFSKSFVANVCAQYGEEDIYGS